MVGLIRLGRLAVVEVVAERKPKGNGENNCALNSYTVHFRQQVRNCVSRGRLAPPGGLGNGLPLQRFEVLLGEIGVDVDVEVELAPRLDRITIEEMTNALGLRPPVDAGCEKDRQPKVGMEISYGRQPLDNASEAIVRIDFEVGEIGKAAVASVAM